MVGSHWGVTVAVIFSDIVRSTELLFELGDERYEGIRRRHFADLRELIAEYGAREVKNTGDGMMIVVPSAAAAIALSVAIQQRTAQQAASARVDLAVRVGASIGDAVEDAGDFYGAGVIEAARLCALATPGEILATSMLCAIAGDRAGAAFEPVGAKALKGMPVPVELSRVTWAPVAAAPAFSHPAMLSGQGRYALVGREREREQVLDVWRAVTAGERRVLLLAGEPGVGKSRLLSEVAAAVHASGCAVLVGRCDREGGGPFQPFVLALRQYLDERAAQGRDAELGPAGGTLVRLLPELVGRTGVGAAAPPSGDATTDRLVLFDAVADALHRVAANTPLLFVVEDLHWAGPQTIQLLRHLAGWPRSAPLLVACTYRATELEPGSELARFVAESNRLWNSERIVLEGLDEASVLALVGQAAGRDVADDHGARELATALCRQTSGNALYATQLLAHLVDSGALDASRRGRGSLADVGLPTNVRDVVLERVESAGPDVSRMLDLAAVAGERVDALLLEQVDDLGGRLLDAVERAVDLQLLEPVSGGLEFRFVHALVRAAVYERMSALRRTRLHDQMATCLERTGVAEAALLAHHAVAAAGLGPDRAARAVDAAASAGAGARAAFEYDSAAAWYARALEHLAPTPANASRRAELLFALGTSQRDAGIADFRETLFEAAGVAADAGLVELQVASVLENTRGYFASSRGLDRQRIELLRTCLSVVGPNRPAERARLLANLAMELTVAPGITERQSLAEEAVGLARDLDDPYTLAWVLARRETALVHITTIEQRRAGLDELLSIVDHLPDESLRFRAWSHAPRMGFELGDPERIATGMGRVRELAERLRQPNFRLLQARLGGTLASLEGRFDDAERFTFEAGAIDRELGSPDAGATFMSQLFSIRFLQGRLAEFVEPMGRTNRDLWIESVWAGWALLLAESGDAEGALATLARQHDLDFWDYPACHTATSGIAAASLAAARVGDTAIAERLLPVLDAAAGCCIADACYFYGPVAHHQGILRAITGDGDAAARHFAEAMAVEERLGARPWLARTLAEAARVQRARGEVDAADASARRATELVDELGLAGLTGLLAEPLPTQ